MVRLLLLMKVSVEYILLLIEHHLLQFHLLFFLLPGREAIVVMVGLLRVRVLSLLFDEGNCSLFIRGLGLFFNHALLSLFLELLRMAVIDETWVLLEFLSHIM